FREPALVLHRGPPPKVETLTRVADELQPGRAGRGEELVDQVLRGAVDRVCRPAKVPEQGEETLNVPGGKRAEEMLDGLRVRGDEEGRWQASGSHDGPRGGGASKPPPGQPLPPEADRLLPVRIGEHREIGEEGFALERAAGAKREEPRGIPHARQCLLQEAD